MPRTVTDEEISSLLADPKPLPKNWQTRLRRKPKSHYAYTEAQLDVVSHQSRRYRLIVRGNRLYVLDFSVILVFEETDGAEYILRRHNGAHPSRHTNRWEKAHKSPNAVVGVGFHIHYATERYQLDEYPIDGYAEATSDYWDIDSAVGAMCCQSAKVGQIGTREDYCYEELRVSSLRVLL